MEERKRREREVSLLLTDGHKAPCACIPVCVCVLSGSISFLFLSSLFHSLIIKKFPPRIAVIGSLSSVPLFSSLLFLPGSSPVYVQVSLSVTS